MTVGNASVDGKLEPAHRGRSEPRARRIQHERLARFRASFGQPQIAGLDIRTGARSDNSPFRSTE